MTPSMYQNSYTLADEQACKINYRVPW
jgi:hypothetical protein